MDKTESDYNVGEQPCGRFEMCVAGGSAGGKMEVKVKMEVRCSVCGKWTAFCKNCGRRHHEGGWVDGCRVKPKVEVKHEKQG